METPSTDFDFELCSYKENLMAFAMSFTHNIDDADDLVQETFLKAVRYAKKFKKGTNLKAWLFMILRNTFINSYRRKNLAKIFMDDNVDININPGMGVTFNLGVGKCVMNDINRALKRLEPQYYIPFIKYFEGYKYHEIAELLKIPIGTVKTRIHVARGILKSTLKMSKERFSGPDGAFYINSYGRKAPKSDYPDFGASV
jgi:RNA polymerase sigma factor (sigma-70 family)